MVSKCSVSLSNTTQAPYLGNEASNQVLTSNTGLGLNNSIILQQIGYAKGNNVYEIFHNQAVGNLIITCAGAIPGKNFSSLTKDFTKNY